MIEVNSFEPKNHTGDYLCTANNSVTYVERTLNIAEKTKLEKLSFDYCPHNHCQNGGQCYIHPSGTEFC